ncbi:MAG TPA: ankyrin repeat domain-containing protein, partial [Planctomycetota bacterium]
MDKLHQAFAAIQQGRLDTLQSLLSQGALDLSETDHEGRSILDVAIGSPKPEVVTTLLQNCQ